ncbi:MAG: flavodoxin family protein [Candidatus Omnitrophota bacterium]
MRVLGINGSPRIGGNTDILLDKALEGAKSKGRETEKVILNNLKMVPCQECEKVRDDGTCKIADDFQDLYEEKIKKADALILASPIFFGSLSAQVKIMIDRFQCCWRYKYLLKKPVTGKQKPGALILVEASHRESFLNNAKSIIKNLFATIDVAYKEELFCPGLEGKSDVSKHPDFLQKAFGLGERLS